METNKDEQPKGMPNFEPIFEQLSTSMASIKPSLEMIQKEVEKSAPVSTRKVSIKGIECVATLTKGGNIILEIGEKAPLLFDSLDLK